MTAEQNLSVVNSIGAFLGSAAAKLSLIEQEQRWSETLKSSLVLKPVGAVFGSVEKLVPPDLARIGGILQSLSFGLTVLLFALIGLPQFATDKFGLAFVVIAGLGLWLLGRLLGGSQRLRFDAFDGIVLAYLAANVIAAFASHYFVPSLKGLTKVIIYIGSYFLFRAVLSGSLKRKLIVVGMALACGAALSLYGLYQYKIGVAPLATWEDPTVESTGTRIFATLGNPNLLAGLLVPLTALAFGLGLGFLVQARDAANRLKFGIPGIVILGIAGLIGLATMLTQSRGGYLGLIAGVGLILYIGSAYVWRKHRSARGFVLSGVIALICAAAIAVQFVPPIKQRFESITAGREHSSNSYRLNVYGSSFKMFKDNWWVGTGPGNETFRLAYGLYMVSGYDALGTYCVPLEVAVETGIPGLLTFIAMILCAMARAHVKFWDSNRPELARWFAAGLAAALMGLMIHGIADTVFYRPQVHFLFWLIMAAIISADYPNEPGMVHRGEESR